MIRILDYNSIDKEKFFDFCKKETMQSKDPAAINMWSEDWMNNPNSLLYMLEVKKFFGIGSGKFFIAFDNDKIIGCSGVYRATFNKNIAIAGVRSWITESYRNQHIIRNYCLPFQKKWAIKYSTKCILLSVNDYNKNLLKAFTRARLGEKKISRNENYLFYKNYNELSYPVKIRGTKQWIAYEVIDPNFNFDWSSIAWQD